MGRLEGIIRRWGWRLRWLEGTVWGTWGAVGGLALATALSLAARLWPLLPARWLAVAALTGAALGAVGGTLAALARPRTLHKLARTLDRRLALAERLTTAVEIGQGRLRVVPAMAAAQLQETLEAVAQVDVDAALPIRPPRRGLVALTGLAAALVLFLLLPNPQEGVLARRAAVRAAVEEQIEALEARREAVAQAEGLTEADREAILRALEEAIAALEKGRTSPEEAVAALAEAERQLAPLQDPGAAAVREGLDRAARAMADSDLTREIAEALARGDYRGAAEALAAYASDLGEALSREEELELARQLAEAAAALGEGDPELARHLTEAAQAIERGDIREARQRIAQAAQQMAEAGARVERQEEVERALAALQEGRGGIAQAAGAGGGGAGTGGGQGAAQQSGQGGRGQTGQEQAGGGQAGPASQGMSGHHEDAGTGAPYDEVFVPYRLEEGGAPLNLGREGEGGPPLGSQPLPATAGQATVPYREVYADYAAQAHAALESRYIPLGIKQYVRDYFTSLEP